MPRPEVFLQVKQRIISRHVKGIERTNGTNALRPSPRTELLLVVRRCAPSGCDRLTSPVGVEF